MENIVKDLKKVFVSHPSPFNGHGDSEESASGVSKDTSEASSATPAVPASLKEGSVHISRSTANHIAHAVTSVAEIIPTWRMEDAEREDVDDFVESTFASRYTASPIAKNKLPQFGAPANVVYQLIRDIRQLDATPSLNLASFVTTWMEPEAEKLMLESMNVNYVDAEEYPSSTEIQNRCVSMLSKLYHSPSVPDHGKGDPVGTATVGSSEAIMLGALAMKKRWQARRAEVGLDTTKPNLVMGAQTHICWQKFCRYFDVEERYVPVEEGRYCATAELMKPLIDENTIGVACVFGSTYTGEFEDVKSIDAMLSEVNAANDWAVPIHVDGASGAMVAPFLFPDLVWDFRLPNVVSINISGHKYGLVYPGLGWVVWRDAEHLPSSIVFEENYLGSVERSITLNFSKGASQIIAQYYQFLRLGFNGYRKIMTNLHVIKKRLQAAVEKTGHFEILSQDVGVPLVAFRLKKAVGSDNKEHRRLYTEYDVADRLRMRGWVLPAYTMPANAEHVTLLRVTIREDLSMQMVDQLVADMENAIAWLDSHYIFTDQQLRSIARTLGDRQASLRRFDSSIVPDPSKMKVRPC